MYLSQENITATIGFEPGHLDQENAVYHRGLRDVSPKNQFLPGRFAQKIFFERDVSSRDGSRNFQKNDFKVLVIKINQVNAMCMLNLLWI